MVDAVGVESERAGRRLILIAILFAFLLRGCPAVYREIKLPSVSE